MDTIGNTKQISDYLHLYLGCEIEHDKGIYRGTLVGIGSGFLTAEIDCDFFKRNTHGHKVPKGKDFGTYNIQMWRLKPILRPLSDMTKEELQECGNLVYDFSDDESGLGLNEHKWQDFTLLLCAEQFYWLIQRGFDLFGLIEAGLAINKTKFEK